MVFFGDLQNAAWRLWRARYLLGDELFVTGIVIVLHSTSRFFRLGSAHRASTTSFHADLRSQTSTKMP